MLIRVDMDARIYIPIYRNPGVTMQTMKLFASKRPSRGEALRAVESMAAGHDRTNPAAPPSSAATSVTFSDLEASERCSLGHSLCAHHRLLLVEFLVQLFAVHTRFVPPTARRLLAPSDLPPALERVAMQAQRDLQAWVAWMDEPSTWFVVAEMAESPGPHCQGEAIRMRFYDADGRLVSRGTWVLQPQCNWILCEP